MEEELNMRVFPVIEDSDFEYAKLVENHFAFEIPQENQLVPPGMGEMVDRSELMELRHKIVELAVKYGFRDIDTKLTKNKNDFDREFSILIYNEMNITASVAATIQSFLFINLKVIPDITKSLMSPFKLGKEIIGINNFSNKNFEINAFSSHFFISLNFFLIKTEII